MFFSNLFQSIPTRGGPSHGRYERGMSSSIYKRQRDHDRLPSVIRRADKAQPDKNAMRSSISRMRLLFFLTIVTFVCVFVANLIFTRTSRIERRDAPDPMHSQTPSFGDSIISTRDAISLEKIQQPGPRAPEVFFPQKLVHIDLKGAPLNVAYFEAVLPLLRKLGTTGLLMEYEDMFPYSGSIKHLSATNAYTRDDVKRILRAAKANNLAVIPLVQTFGHMEFALKLAENKEMREEPANPQAICPSRNASVLLIKEILRQITELHKDHITHVHLGCDEVYALGSCQVCRDRMAANYWSKSELLLDHVTMVVKAAHDLRVQPIIWDDMFRSIDGDALRQSPLLKLVEIMVWSYGKTIDLQWIIEKYNSAGFLGIWVASAFKGSTKPNHQVPEFREHLLNHYAWVQSLKGHRDIQSNLKGIAITGWQRYDHFAALCELFPVALPVLGVCLAYLDNGRIDQRVIAELRTKLECPDSFEDNSRWDINNERLVSMPLFCNYPSGNVSADIDQLMELTKLKVDIEGTNYELGWLTNMNKEKKFTSPRYVESAIAQLPEILPAIKRLEDSIMTDFQAFTDRATAREWIATFIQPLRQWFENLQKDAESLLGIDEWPRRPLYDNN